MRERTTDRPAAVEAPESLERYGRAELPAILAEARAAFPGARLPAGWAEP